MALPFTLFVTGAVSLAFCFLAAVRFRNSFHNPVRAYPKAADYFTYCAAASRTKTASSIVLLSAGGAFALAAPLLAEHYPFDIIFALEAATAGGGAFFTVYYLLERKIFSRITLIPVKDETDM